MARDDTISTTVTVSKELWKRFKLRFTEREMNMKAAIEEAIEAWSAAGVAQGLREDADLQGPVRADTVARDESDSKVREAMDRAERGVQALRDELREYWQRIEERLSEIEGTGQLRGRRPTPDPGRTKRTRKA